MDDNFINIENAFFSDGYKLGMKAFSQIGNKGILFESISEMYAAIDNFNEALSEFSKHQNQPIECKKGCEWCCHQPVFALSYELDYLNNFIHSHFDEAAIVKIKIRAEHKNKKLGNLKGADLQNAKFPCPLLENGACLAYMVRPMACRIYLSTDVKTCLSFFNEPAKKESIPALLNLPLRAGQIMNEGFKAALKTNGVIAWEFRIEEKLV